MDTNNQLATRIGDHATPYGISIHYEDRGALDAPAILLIMGLGAQMTVWPEDFCNGLVQKGFRVIRFDNRDVGLSTHIDAHTSPNLVKTWMLSRMNKKVDTPYKIKDMVKDTISLMDGLNIKKAHIVGASMGGMIGQVLTAKHKKRVLSLTSLMSTTGRAGIPKANPRVLLHLSRRPKKAKPEQAINYIVKMNQLIGSPAYPEEEDTLFEDARFNYERAQNTSGYKRQLLAVTATKDRRKLVKKIKVPTLIIHGTQDAMIPVRAAKTAARRIKRAKLKIIDGMGHNIPKALIPKLVKLISKHAKKADSQNKKQRKPKKDKAESKNKDAA